MNITLTCSCSIFYIPIMHFFAPLTCCCRTPTCLQVWADADRYIEEAEAEEELTAFDAGGSIWCDHMQGKSNCACRKMRSERVWQTCASLHSVNKIGSLWYACGDFELRGFTLLLHADLFQHRLDFCLLAVASLPLNLFKVPKLMHHQWFLLNNDIAWISAISPIALFLCRGQEKERAGEYCCSTFGPHASFRGKCCGITWTLPGISCCHHLACVW